MKQFRLAMPQLHFWMIPLACIDLRKKCGTGCSAQNVRMGIVWLQRSEVELSDISKIFVYSKELSSLGDVQVLRQI